jgi:hypothetical protein
MKKGIILIVLLATLTWACSPAIVTTKPLPPGQVKKVTGSKSAKAYAPGQQKKKH